MSGARPQLQLALDLTDLKAATRLAMDVRGAADVLEAGTILVLAHGLGAVERLRTVWLQRPLVADVRIVEAGGLIAGMAFDAGADAVTVFGGTSDTAIAAVVEQAERRAKRVQVEVFEAWSIDRARSWRELGVRELILHRSRDAERHGARPWVDRDLQRIVDAAAIGLEVSVTGGVTSADLDVFTGLPVRAFVVGGACAVADDPARAAHRFREAIAGAFGS